MEGGGVGGLEGIDAWVAGGVWSTITFCVSAGDGRREMLELRGEADAATDCNMWGGLRGGEGGRLGGGG